ncbi:MAG: cellulose biosynthesis cyclic di-GMP-binding regulatory protein BcsB [Calothrix sp. C42_A2020_038]|nr:cellulose biosynthesis cyclic di-GMP-binding regulatory protein BcsB [Calothrix sp. C42_A2020_038]
MKQLFLLSQISKKAFVVTFCLLLFPNALPSARATNSEDVNGVKSQELILAQATPTTQTPRKTDSAKSEETTKGLITYNLEFNRSPIVGNRMRLRGIYSEARLGFTRPRGWKIDASTGTVQALIRFQHSPSLYASRSNLTVLVNGRSVGSTPLNRKQSQVGQLLVNIPPSILQDYNELTVVGQQNNSQECSDPNSPDLWTEILPDSRIIFKYQRQPLTLNFSRYPFPIFDDLGLETNEIVYLQPNAASPTWLTAASRFQAALGRLADFRPIETSMVSSVSNVKDNQRLVIIGTPSEQPGLAELKDLPLKISGGQVLDTSNRPVSEDRGVLMLASTKKEGGAPIIIVTGNSPKAVEKAARFLSQPDLRKMGTGQVVYVDQVRDTTTPGARQWPGHLPEENTFKLSDLKTSNNEPFKDVTVRGAGAPAVEIDFRALPDDRFIRGSSMNLVYSYGPQVNPRTSAVQVFLDGNFIGGARLTNESGESNKSLKVDLPANLIKPDSKLEVFFRMNAREAFDRQKCVFAPDQQLTATVHADTSFDLKRETSVKLPDLNLLKFGYPFAAPQDLSKTAIILPQNPSVTDMLTMLEFSERLGRLSKADAVKLDVYTQDNIPETVRKEDNLVAIGVREKFPLPDTLKSSGFNLSQQFMRSSAQASVVTPQDSQGMIKQVISPWNGERVVLALTAQTETGLERVRQVLAQDPWFFQLKQDTVLIDSSTKDPRPYDPDAFQLAFFDNAPRVNRIENTSPLSKISRLIQDNWILLIVGILGSSLLLYGIVQLYLKRLTVDERK